MAAPSYTTDLVDINLANTKTGWSEPTGSTSGGISGLTVNVSNLTTQFIDIQHTPTGSIRMGIIGPDRTKIVAHEFNNTNAAFRPLLGTLTLPLTFEIFNTEVTDSPTEMRFVSALVATDNDKPFNRFMTSLSSGNNLIDVVGTEERLVYTIGLKELMFGKPNKVGLLGQNIQFLIMDDAPVIFRFYVTVPYGSYTFDGTWQDHPAANSAAIYMTPYAGGGVFKPFVTHYFQYSVFAEKGTPNIDLRPLLENLRAELRRSPDNLTNFASTLTVQCVESTATNRIGFSHIWHEIK